MLKALRPGQLLLFWTLIAITLATRLVLATADFQNLIGLDIYQDDAFYYMKICRNLLDGRGMTFDGTNPTNGFHPLYMLVLLPLMQFSGDDLAAPIRLSAYALTVASVLTGFLLFRVARFVAGPGVALTALALFAISPYFAAFGINGQETGVAMLFGVLVLDRYLRGFRPPARPSLGSAALFGILCGMAVMARSDLVLLLLALATDRILLMFRGSSRATLPKIGVAFGSAFATWMVWGLISHSHTGSWLPRSGDAVRVVARNYGWVNLPSVWHAKNASPLFDPERPPVAFHADVATQLGFVFLFEHPLLAPLRLWVPFSVWPALDRYAPYNAFRRAPAATTAACVALALAAVAWALRRRGVEPKATIEKWHGLGRILLVYLLLMGVGYIFYAPGHWYFPRYLTLPILISIVYGLARGREALRAIPLPPDRARILAVSVTAALVGSQVACLPYAKVRQLRSEVAETRGFYRNWKEIGTRIPAEKKLGSFQAGIYGYFGRRDVVNLDGVVNPAAHAALKEKRLHEYLLSEQIDYILDWNWVVNSLCLRHAPAGSLSLRALGRTSTRPPAVLYSVAAGPIGDSERGRE